MIQSVKVTSPTKLQLANSIATFLGLDEVHASSGSSIESLFLLKVLNKLGVRPTESLTAYEELELILNELGLIYDPNWDSSENTPTGGGSTVTLRAFSRILAALTGVPRCFILNVTDAPVGTRWETEHDKIYRYDNKVTGRNPFNDAGPGSQIIYYSTRNSSDNPRHFTSTATVDYIFPGRTGPWTAFLKDYRELASPIPAQDVVITGRNKQHAISEISFDTYREMLELGNGPGAQNLMTTGIVDQAIVTPSKERTTPPKTSVPVLEDYPLTDLELHASIPDVLISGVLTFESPTTPTYRVQNDILVNSESSTPRFPSDRATNKVIEQRAVQAALQAMTSDGWLMTADRQLDGVGYDLEFTRSHRKLHVEVKGIQSSRLAFNLTPKELWRAQNDPAWILIAVTQALSLRHLKVNVVTRDELATWRRTITGFKMMPPIE